MRWLRQHVGVIFLFMFSFVTVCLLAVAAPELFPKATIRYSPFLRQVLRVEYKHDAYRPIFEARVAMWGTDAIPILKDELSSNDALKRRNAVIGLGYFTGSPEIIQLIADHLVDPDMAVRHFSILQLSKTSPAQVDLAVFLSASKSQDAYLRQASADRLAATADQAVTERLLGMLHDPDESVRCSAVAALGTGHRSDSVAPALAEVAENDSSREVRKLATEALKRLSANTVN